MNLVLLAMAIAISICSHTYASDAAKDVQQESSYALKHLRYMMTEILIEAKRINSMSNQAEINFHSKNVCTRLQSLLTTEIQTTDLSLTALDGLYMSFASPNDYSEEELIFPWIQIVNTFQKTIGFCLPAGETTLFELEYGWLMTTIPGKSIEDLEAVIQRIQSQMAELRRYIDSLPPIPSQNSKAEARSADLT